MDTSKLHLPGWMLLIGAPIALLIVLLFMGGQASTILSTVGSSIGGPNSVGSGRSGSGTSSTAGRSTVTVPGAAGNGTTAGGGVPTTADFVDVSRSDLLVIKTGNLSLQVKSIAEAITAVGTRMTALGGYVSGSQQTGEGDHVAAAITYRIPVARWEDALAAARSLALRVIDEKTQTDDVTAQVVDLGARIANLQATERAFQQIMSQATTIADVLTVQVELTKVRGDIEQATAQKSHFTEEAAYSTLTLAFSLQPKPPAVVAAQQKKAFDPKAEVDRATARLVSRLQVLVTAGIWFSIVWLPFLVPLGVMVLVAVFLLRRVRGHSDRLPIGGSGPPSPPMDAPAPLAG